MTPALSTGAGTIALLTAVCVALSMLLARAHHRLRRLDRARREAETHALAMACQRDALRCDRDRAYETLTALSGEVDRLEAELAAHKRPVMLHCGLPLIEIPVPTWGGVRVVKVGRN